MRLGVFMLFILFSGIAGAQEMERDTLAGGKLIVEKDSRIDVLSEKMAEYNSGLSRKPTMQNGYRLMLLSSTDREKVMALRGKMLQLFPDQKVYTVFQSPYIKLKFGNFLTKEEADKMKKQVAALKLVEGNIYVVPEKVEVKQEKPEKKEVKPNGN